MEQPEKDSNRIARFFGIRRKGGEEPWPADAGTAYLSVVPDVKSFSGQLDSLLAPITSKFEGKMGKFGKAATVGLAGVGLAAGAAGKALYDIGAQFD